MNEGICDFRFALCDWLRLCSGLRLARRLLSLTPWFRGFGTVLLPVNRISGFRNAVRTAEAVQREERFRFWMFRLQLFRYVSSTAARHPSRESQS